MDKREIEILVDAINDPNTLAHCQIMGVKQEIISAYRDGHDAYLTLTNASTLWMSDYDLTMASFTFIRVYNPWVEAGIHKEPAERPYPTFGEFQALQRRVAKLESLRDLDQRQTPDGKVTPL